MSAQNWICEPSVKSPWDVFMFMTKSILGVPVIVQPSARKASYVAYCYFAGSHFHCESQFIDLLYQKLAVQVLWEKFSLDCRHIYVYYLKFFHQRRTLNTHTGDFYDKGADFGNDFCDPFAEVPAEANDVSGELEDSTGVFNADVLHLDNSSIEITFDRDLMIPVCEISPLGEKDPRLRKRKEPSPFRVAEPNNNDVRFLKEAVCLKDEPEFKVGRYPLEPELEY